MGSYIGSLVFLLAIYADELDANKKDNYQGLKQ